MKRWMLPAAIGIALSALPIATSVPPARAHHSIASAYDTNEFITIEGVVTRFHFVNPHPFLTVEVQRAGASAQWTLEMDNRVELAQIGMTTDTLKPGDRIVARGYPAIGARQGLYIRRLDRPKDGFQYEQLGRSPAIRFAK